MLVGYGAGNGGVHSKGRWELELFLCSMAITILLGVVLGPRVLEQKP